jgi:hypothetical protein
MSTTYSVMFGSLGVMAKLFHFAPFQVVSVVVMKNSSAVSAVVLFCIRTLT